MTGIYMIRVTNSAAIASSNRCVDIYLKFVDQGNYIGEKHNYLRYFFINKCAFEFFLIKIFLDEIYTKNLIAQLF